MNGGSRNLICCCGDGIASLVSYMGEVEYSTPEAFRLAPAIIGTPMIGTARRKYIAG